jgi:uncharacterized integral membrane protein (TIGR00697 family)
LISTIIVCAVYVSAQLLANIASLQIVLFAGLSFDAGTFIYPITFTLRDLAHKVLGLKGVRVLIFTAVAINLFMSLFFWFVSILQPDTAAGSSEIWGKVLSPVWRITIASVLSQLVSELVDTEVYRVWVDRITKRYQWMRVLVSNSISVPLDSLTFSFLIMRSRLLAMVAKPLFSAVSLTSSIMAENPAIAALCAIPLPIVPAPMTPITLISLILIVNTPGGLNSV